jgi:hypothetical protein
VYGSKQLDEENRRMLVRQCAMRVNETLGWRIPRCAHRRRGSKTHTELTEIVDVGEHIERILIANERTRHKVAVAMRQILGLVICGKKESSCMQTS